MINSLTLPSMFVKCGRPESLYRPLICFFLSSDIDYEGRVQVPWAALSMNPWEMMSGCLEVSSLTPKGNEDYKTGSLYNHFILCVDFVVKSTRFGKNPVQIVYDAHDVDLRKKALGKDAPFSDPTSALSHRISRRHAALQAILQWFCFNKKYEVMSESAWEHMVAFTGLENPTFVDVEKAVLSTNHVLKKSARYPHAIALSMAYRLGCEGRPANFKGKD